MTDEPESTDAMGQSVPSADRSVPFDVAADAPRAGDVYQPAAALVAPDAASIAPDVATTPPDVSRPPSDASTPELDGSALPEPDAGPTSDSLGARLLACWLRVERALPDDFEAPAAGRGLGLFNFGFGIYSASLIYALDGWDGPLSVCAGQLIGSEEQNWSAVVALARVAGIEPLVQSDRPSSANFYDPALIDWAATHLIPAPDDVVGGIPVLLVYQEVMAPYFRQTAETYLYLVEHGLFASEVEALAAEELLPCEPDMYACPWEVTVEPGGSSCGWAYIACRFSVLPAPNAEGWDWPDREPDLWNVLTPLELAYFWLRRGYDGTDDEVFAALRAGFLLYDPEWFSGLAARYPNASVVW